MADLAEIGLTKNESKVFRTLIRFGKSSAHLISKESGVPYGKVYNVLADLEHKGLVKILPEKGKKFIPNDPEFLLKLVESRRKSLKSVEIEIKKMKKFYNVSEQEPVEIAKGKRNFYKIEKEIPRPKKLMYNIKYGCDFRKDWISKRGVRGEIEWKELVRFDKETEKNVRKWLAVHKKIRKIPNEGVSVLIRDDSMVMIVLIKSNTILLIRDSPFVKLIKELFESYYRHAEEIK